MLNIDRSFWNDILSVPEGYQGPAIGNDHETSAEAESDELSSVWNIILFLCLAIVGRKVNLHD